MRKTVFITGSSSGIGKACVLKFKDKGWNVSASMRNPQKENELTILENIITPKVDVTDSESIKSAILETIDKFGQIDAVVNNAGYALVGPFEASTIKQVDEEFATNVTGLMNVTREILPYFRKQRSGVVANISSMGGMTAFPLYSVYHATKWAVEGFSESLQQELIEFNIKVKIIEPGRINTDFYTSSLTLMQKAGLDEYDEYVNKVLPYLQKFGRDGSDPKVVAETVYKACIDNSLRLRYPTGKSAQLILLARKILPDALFTKAIQKILSG